MFDPLVDPISSSSEHQCLKYYLGQSLAIVGSVLSTAGALINNLTLNHILAMHVWQFSNFFLLAWAIGFYKKWWSNGLGSIALISMYLVFFVTNEIGLHW